MCVVCLSEKQINMGKNNKHLKEKENKQQIGFLVSLYGTWNKQLVFTSDKTTVGAMRASWW